MKTTLFGVPPNPSEKPKDEALGMDPKAVEISGRTLSSPYQCFDDSL